MSALPGPLREYDRGPHPFAALVGSAITGLKEGYGLRQTIRKDREDIDDRETDRLMKAIRLRIELEQGGYNPDDLTGDGVVAPRQPQPTHPGHRPMDEDPRDFGINRPALPGMHGYDPYAPRSIEELADPFRIEGQSVDPGMTSRFPQGRDPDPGFGRVNDGPSVDPRMDARNGNDIRNRVAELLFRGTPRLRKTSENSQERAARVQDERISARESARDAQFMAREQLQQDSQDSRQAAQLSAQERMNEADNRTSLGVARINATGRLDVAEARGAAQPNALQAMQRAIASVKGMIDGWDRAIAQAERAIPEPTPQQKYSSRSRAEYDARVEPQRDRINTLRAQRDEWDRRRAAMTDRMLQGIFEFRDLLPAAPGATAEPRLDMRGRPTGGPITSSQRAPSSLEVTPASSSEDPNSARRMADAAIVKIRALGLPPDELQRRLAEVERRYLVLTGERR